MSEKKSDFERVFTFTKEENTVFSEFCNFEKFVDSVVSLFNLYISFDDLLGMKCEIIKFIQDNQKLFGFYTFYSYIIYYDLVNNSFSKLR